MTEKLQGKQGTGRPATLVGVIGGIIAIVVGFLAYQIGYKSGYRRGGLGSLQMPADTGTVSVQGTSEIHFGAMHGQHVVDSPAIAAMLDQLLKTSDCFVDMHDASLGRPPVVLDRVVLTAGPAGGLEIIGLTSHARNGSLISGKAKGKSNGTPTDFAVSFATATEASAVDAKLTNQFVSGQFADFANTRVDLVVMEVPKAGGGTEHWGAVRRVLLSPNTELRDCKIH